MPTSLLRRCTPTSAVSGSGRCTNEPIRGPDGDAPARIRARLAGADITDVVDVWTAYRSTGGRALRDQLVLHYTPLVKQVAARVAVGLPSSVDRADLVSAGIVGLLEAIERFDANRGAPFESYAMARIRGAIVDELRAADWVPRSVRAKARAIEAAYQEVEARLHRVPTDEELAAAAGLTVEQLHIALSEISATGLVALDEATALR